MPEVNTAEVAAGDGQEKEQVKAISAEAHEAGTEGDAKETDDEIESPKKKGGWLRKLEKKDQQIEALIQALNKVGGNANTKQETSQVQEKPPEKPAKPKLAQFQTYEEYQSAVDAWEDQRDKYYDDKLAYELKSRLSKADQEKQEISHRQTVADGWAQQVAKAREEFEDFDEIAFSPEVPMSNAMMEAITTSEHGAKIAYELGTNPDEADRISRLSAIAAAREIGKIESRIANSKSADAEEGEQEEEVKPKPSATKAPKPPSTVRRQSGTSNEPRDSDDYKTWLRKRNAEIKARNG